MTNSVDTDADAGDVFQQLLKAARDGDSRALGQLLNDCRDYLLLIAYQEIDPDLRGKLGASDLVQQTMADVQGNLAQFRGETQEEFVGWLRGALRNDLRDVQRQYKRTKGRRVQNERALSDPNQLFGPLVDSTATPFTHALLDEQAELIEQAMSQLPETYRQVIRLKNWSQMSFTEIGEQMQIGPDAARKTWLRAIVKLEKILKPLLGSTIQPSTPTPPPEE